jgi:hypothetical protein
VDCGIQGWSGVKFSDSMGKMGICCAGRKAGTTMSICH